MTPGNGWGWDGSEEQPPVAAPAAAITTVSTGPTVDDNDDDDDVGDRGAGESLLYFATVAEFVEQFLAPTFGRDLARPTLTWCPEWWRHPEALYRLECLWRAWEHLRTEPHLGASRWICEHLDHHLPVLMDAMGPFKGYSPAKGHRVEDLALPCTPAPAGLFTT